MRHALVFGASGQIGAALCERLRDDGWRLTALSRMSRPSNPGCDWLQGEFAELPALPRQVDALFSCGPLDLFSHWFAVAGIAAGHVVAFGSTSAQAKRDSPDPAERELAARLQSSEQRILVAAAERGSAATLLRPTLVYGAARDRTLSRIAELARRYGRLVLPSNAVGARQPVHVDDLAAAAQAVLASPYAGQRYDLPGGESLAYLEMVQRVLSCLSPQPRLYRVPPPVFAGLLGVARRVGIASDFSPAAVARLRYDLAFDAAPARRDLGYAPRAFQPVASMFGTP